MGGLNIKNAAGGLLMTAIGLFFLIGAFDYSIGTPQRMGPGYVPMLLGIALTGIGVVILSTSLAGPARFPPLSWRFLGAVLGSIAVFALSVERFGLLPAVAVAAGVAALGDPGSRVRSTLLLIFVLAAGSWLIFRAGLGLPIPAFRGWPS